MWAERVQVAQHEHVLLAHEADHVLDLEQPGVPAEGAKVRPDHPQDHPIDIERCREQGVVHLATQAVRLEQPAASQEQVVEHRHTRDGDADETGTRRLRQIGDIERRGDGRVQGCGQRPTAGNRR